MKMQAHVDIGYRIAQSSVELQPIADWVLKHHEWWNGKGCPLVSAKIQFLLNAVY